jgi:hypothetical protein
MWTVETGLTAQILHIFGLRRTGQNIKGANCTYRGSGVHPVA